MQVDKKAPPREILEAARSEAVRTLARASVTCIAYDAIADMFIKTVRMLHPEIDEKIITPVDPSFLCTDAVVPPVYRTQRLATVICDPVENLWEEDVCRFTAEQILRAAEDCRIVQHTLRGQLRYSGYQAHDLIISALVRKEEEDNNGEEIAGD